MGCGVWGVGCGVWGVGCGGWYRLWIGREVQEEREDGHVPDVLHELVLDAAACHTGRLNAIRPRVFLSSPLEICKSCRECPHVIDFALSSNHKIGFSIRPHLSLSRGGCKARFDKFTDKTAQNLHPTLYTLHPTPYTRHPKALVCPVWSHVDRWERLAPGTHRLVPSTHQLAAPSTCQLSMVNQ